jgi:hypothetical protein
MKPDFRARYMERDLEAEALAWRAEQPDDDPEADDILADRLAVLRGEEVAG